VTFYGQILYPALLGNNWIYEMYYYNNKKKMAAPDKSYIEAVTGPRP
jgi:hypothetical protein